MALTGQLSDLSLAELIEFFCNQRKTGRLKVIYPEAPGYFYIQAGSLVDARIGSLNGVEAVYYALTLPNASFKFSPVFEATRRTIHQPWSQVVLEGLRRIDEGITQKAYHPEASETKERDVELEEITESEIENLAAFKACEEADGDHAPMPLMVQNAADGSSSRKRTLLIIAAALALVASVAVIGVPAGWYGKAKSQAAVPTAPAASPSSTPAMTEAATAATDDGSSATQSQPEESKDEASAPDAPNNDAILAARREREARDRERMLRLAEERANAANAKQPESASSQAQANSSSSGGAVAVKKTEAPRTGPKMVSVQVTYDEAGRVTQASGGDATALRIARQKRFPAGKAGSTTVTIPMN